MIRILNESLEEQGYLYERLSSYDTEELNSGKYVGGTFILTKDNTGLITGSNIMEVNDDYYDIVYYKKGQSSSGDLSVDLEGEHVSYRLNDSDYDLDYFTELGEPSEILALLLDGTDFSVGTVEFTGETAYSMQESMSRRLALMDFVDYLGGEIQYDKFTISIVERRGSSTAKDLTSGRNIEVIDKTYNERETDDDGDPLISYTCSLIKPMDVDLGDSVTLTYETLDIDVELRVISITKDPYDSSNVTFEIGNFVAGLEDEYRQIEVSSVIKGNTYYGAKISSEVGFESVRSDGQARAYFNADYTAMQKLVDDVWKNVLYFDADLQEFIFDGKLTADVIEAASSVITKYIQAEGGTIARLTVDQLDTSDMVQNYLNEDTSDVNYIRVYDQYINFIQATTDGLAT
ncbi:MAG: phage tail protein, partial [Sphaerochaetaceae bacterium]